MKIREWIEKNAVLKDGVSLDELESLVKDLDPLKNIKSKDDAYDFMLRNDVFKSALDYETQKRVDNALNRFKEEKLPDILKSEGDKVRAELNPEETPEQKEIRELKEWKQQQLKKENDFRLKEELRTKAKELSELNKVNYDPLRAEMFSVYGESAHDMLEKDVTYIKSILSTELDKQIKDRFGNQTPKKAQIDSDKLITEDEFNNMDSKAKASFMASGGNIK